ncbi:MAG: hypothetical protein KKG09_01665 [Verrucomicrobia bacterium]|nr:hypothetical protein [Verrucomicrobiota bacterium]MBU4292383.1 hypothetical protein [Verrucomicrobiota bacterium]MBU4428214.1 hypothetical protein [Verrucomicrobiota bacterium]MBU4496701.1 hypothetical protein [Verrucomicrobiota bacterium]MCG2679113.1 hypothetical protein [Kiritimatiellia bacterium]
MANLFWRTKKRTKALVDRPFKTEAEFEKTVFESSELLKDIFQLKRQIRGGNKSGIPDIIGIDADGSVCIIEMKNCEVDASIIPQVLQYAFWAETNPDSIRALWLECENKPEDIQVAWDDLQVRIIVIAPTILRSSLHLVNKIGYPVDLIEVKRWVEGDNEFLLVNRLEEEAPVNRQRRPVSGLRVYDEAFYKTERNSKSVDEFIRYAREIERLVAKKGWQLETKFNRGYCGFKAGFFNAFGVKWWGTKSFGIFVKITQSEAKRFNPSPANYANLWKEAYYKIETGKTKTNNFLPIFEFAYRKLAGRGEG